MMMVAEPKCVLQQPHKKPYPAAIARPVAYIRGSLTQKEVKEGTGADVVYAYKLKFS